MLRGCHLWAMLVLALTLTAAAVAQQDDAQSLPKNQAPPRSDTDTTAPQPEDSPKAIDTEPGRPPRSTPATPAGESSSRSTIMDISPPVGDAQEHPDSEVPEELSGVTEMHPWNPHKAEKNLEIGDYYFKEKNYRAAESRYREALYYKENDALATYRLAVVLDKTGHADEARQYYEAYLKILPHGPNAADAHKALERLGVQSKNRANDSPRGQH